jgi:outer membrane protein
MKKILLTSLMILGASTTVVFANPNANKIGVGGGVLVGDSLFKDTKNGSDPMFLPIMDIKYNDLTVRGTNIDYEVYANDMFAMSLFLDPLSGYPVEAKNMASGFEAIEDRDNLIALGTKLKVKTPGGTSTNLSFKGGDKGMQSSLALSKTFRVTNSLTVVPSIKANLFSEDFSEYYFGISEGERDRNSGINSTYSPERGYSLGLSLSGEYAFNEKMSLMVFMGIEQVSEEIELSPIVENDFIWSSGLGLKYFF